jgi:hypothetical protein
MYKIKDMVQPGTKVTFIHYQKGMLWYRHDNGFEFPVPVEDTQDGVFLSSDKAILFMRYMRKEIARIEEGKLSND